MQSEFDNELRKKLEIEEKEVRLAYNYTALSYMQSMNKSIENWKKISIALIVAILLICAMFAGSWLYFISTYEVEVLDTTTTTYEQSSDGESQIINGNSYNDNSVHNAKED